MATNDLVPLFLADPAEYWKVARERGPAVLVARPNAGHHALAELESAGHITTLVTQNTDGLHKDARFRSTRESYGVELFHTGRRGVAADFSRSCLAVSWLRLALLSRAIFARNG